MARAEPIQLLVVPRAVAAPVLADWYVEVAGPSFPLEPYSPESMFLSMGGAAREYVYFSQEDSVRMRIKVGWSLNPGYRIRALHHEPLVAIGDVGRHWERYIHRILHDHGLGAGERRGPDSEFFRGDSALICLARRLQSAATLCFWDSEAAPHKRAKRHCRYCRGEGHTGLNCPGKYKREAA